MTKKGASGHFLKGLTTALGREALKTLNCVTLLSLLPHCLRPVEPESQACFFAPAQHQFVR